MSRWSVTILAWSAVMVGAASYAGFPVASLRAQSAAPQAARTQAEPAQRSTGAARPAAVRTAAGQSAVEDDAAFRKATLDKYCVTCHSARTRTAGLVLQNVDVQDVASNPE